MLALLRAAGDHPTVEELTAHVCGLSGEDPPGVARHLFDCPDCREQSELLRQSFERLHAPPSESARPVVVGVPAYWRVLAAAGMIFALLGLLLALLARDHAVEMTAHYEAALAQIAALEHGFERVHPSLNVLVQEISPASLTQRDPSSSNRLEIPAVSREVTLILGTDPTAPEPETLAAEVELELQAAGRIVWRKPGLVRFGTGDYTVSFSTAELPEGESELRLYSSDGVLVDRYVLSVSRGR